MAAAQDAQSMPFIKNLASSDRKLRTASLSSLQAFLSSRRDLSPLDARKLWTGLYYALWMTDRPRPQQSLAADLAALLFALPAPCAGPWLSGFWAVLGAQWISIEALRLDKFLLLARRVFAAHVRFAQDHKFTGDGSVILAVMREWCFDPQDERRVALGLRLHLLDVWVDELHREGVLSVEGHAAAGFVAEVGGLVRELAQKTPNKAIRQRALQSYGDERLPWAQVGDDNDDEDEDDEWGGLDD